MHSFKVVEQLVGDAGIFLYTLRGYNAPWTWDMGMLRGCEVFAVLPTGSQEAEGWVIASWWMAIIAFAIWLCSPTTVWHSLRLGTLPSNQHPCGICQGWWSLCKDPPGAFANLPGVGHGEHWGTMAAMVAWCWTMAGVWTIAIPAAHYTASRAIQSL